MPPAIGQSPLPRPVLLLLGGPGSGKGTHGQTLADALGFEHLSSGEHFRDHIHRETPLGLQAKAFIEKGQLVPDDLTLELVRTMIAGHPSACGFVLDGYPRTLAQAEDLEAFLPELGAAVTQTLYLDISDDEMLRRLTGRLTCRACGATCHETAQPPARAGVCDDCGGELFRRDDDEPATIRRRITVFHRQIDPLLSFYRDTGRLEEVPAEGPKSEVGARVVAAAKTKITKA